MNRLSVGAGSEAFQKAPVRFAHGGLVNSGFNWPVPAFQNHKVLESPGCFGWVRPAKRRRRSASRAHRRGATHRDRYAKDADVPEGEGLSGDAETGGP
jgi:hypothetical protein